jgi:hypothetical protein
MKLLAAVLVVVLAAVIGVAAFAMANLRALVGAHKDRLVARVERVVGRPITVEAVEPSWWPLGIRLRRVTIGEDPSFGSDAFVVADGVVMSVRAWPLVHGRIEAAGVVLDRPTLTLRRAPSGDWNVGSLGEATEDGEKSGADKAGHKDRRRGFRVPLEWAVGVALSQVRDGTVTIETGKGTPLVLRHVHLHADDVRLGATARLRLEAAVFDPDDADLLVDLRASNLGQQDVAHSPFSVRVELRDADVAAVSGWLGRSDGTGGTVEALTVDASGTLERLRAVLDVRADDPALRVGGLPLGRLGAVALQGRVGREHATVAIESLRATAGDLVLEANGTVAEDPWRVALDVRTAAAGTAPVVVGGTTIPVCAVDGRVVVDREGAKLEPLRHSVGGVVLETRGWVTGAAPPVLDLHVDGRPFAGALAADVAVEASGAARARLEATDVDLAAALARLAPALEHRVEGRASGAAVVTGRVGDGGLVPGSLAGDGSVTVRDGKLRDVNLPDLVVEQIERIPLMPQLVSARTRARYAELFGSRDTVVTSASLPFTLARGRLVTDRAVLENPAYQVTGDGWLDEAQQLRFRGTVLLGASVSKTLRDDVRAAKYLAADDGRITLPFVARGRLGAVWVEPDGKRLRSRGLTALLGKPLGDDGADRNRGDSRRDDEPVEDRVIERLERMLHP